MAAPNLPERFRFNPLYVIIVVGGLLIGGLYFKEIAKYIRNFTPAETGCHLDSTYVNSVNGTTMTKSPSSKLIYTYNTGGKLESTLNQIHISNTGSPWQNHEKYDYSYSASGDHVSMIWHTWNTSTNSWENAYKTDSVYIGGKIASYTNQAWEAASQTWVNKLKIIYTYNTDGKLERLINQIWITTSSASWQNNDSKDLYYNTSGVLTTDSIRTWNINSWNIAYGFSEYLYNVAGQLSQKTEKHLDGNPSLWQNYSTNIYTYNSNDQLIKDVYQNVNPPDFVFNNFKKHEYSYVGNGCLQTDNLIMAETAVNYHWEARYFQIENFYTNLP